MSRFLVIDDDPMICQMCSAYFGSKGHQVITARDGKEGIEKFEKADYDLIITDLMMPKRHGYEVIDLVKTSSKGEKVPVILLTADAHEPDLELYNRRKFQDDTLTKPFDIPMLEHKVNDLLQEFAEREF